MKQYYCDCGAQFLSLSGVKACISSHYVTKPAPALEPTGGPSARRVAAVEDFEAIGQRLRELQPVVEGYSKIAPKPPAASQGGPAGGAVNYLPDDLRDIDKRPYPYVSKLTNSERQRIASAYDCTWTGAKNHGCGNPSGKSCLIAGRCKVKTP